MHGVAVLVDPFSAQYLRGAVVDFNDSLTGGGFKISNPNARQSCGCGKSFTA
jgi:iron-sulfur cluster assembly accessory protein